MPKVWFQLFNAARNEWSSAVSIKYTNGDDIDDFRKEVKKEYANKLAQVDAGDLRVYANRTAFDAVNRQPLEEDSLIGTLDGSKKDALVVVVPGRAGGEASVPSLPTTQTDGIHHPTRLKRWADLNEVLDRNKKAKCNEGLETSTGYSYVSYNEVEKILRATSYEQQSKTIADEDVGVLYAYLLRVSKVFGAIETGKEAKRLHFIAPILVCVCWLFDGDVQILVEERVDGKRLHGHGFFEFVIQRGMKRVCIVEAKRDDFQQGIAQNLVGCEALADIEGLKKVYGIVTNYKEWFFFRSLDERIERDEATIHTAHDIPTRASVKNIAEKIYSMLSEDD